MTRLIAVRLSKLVIAVSLALTAAGAISLATAARAEVPSPLVSAEWLAGQLDRDDLVVIDVRETEAFEAGHVPGSIHTVYPGAWRTERDGIPWVLPDVPDLEAFLSSIGVGNDKTVVLVPAGRDATELGRATWPYWVLKYLGHDAVAVLDGGWKAWQADAARPVDDGPSQPQPAGFTADLRPDILISTAEVANRLGGPALIVDARPPNQYLGETKSGLAVRAGRIPGALNVPTASLFDADAGRLKPRDGLAAIVSPILADKDREIVVYCNTGHWSSTDWFVFRELLGYSNVRLYEESTAGWTRDASLPVETGPEAQ